MIAKTYESAIRAPWLLPQARQPHQVAALAKDSLLLSQSQPPPTPPSPSSPGSRISPAVLFIIVILAVVFFISGLLHLLVRFLIKKHPFSASPNPESRGAAAAAEFQGSDALQRQLQQLFHLHDSGLDQAFIDALPVFLYREIVGSKEPFDCAVCLCEFAPDDKLRLLPACGHAFHINCIDTWLLSNSTCPLCRGTLFVSGGLAVDNPAAFDFEDPTEDDRNHQEASERVFSVRLGKFKNICNGDEDGDSNGIAAAASLRMEEGETSSNNLDARRCFSMGYYQYVVAESNLQVTLDSSRVRNGDLKGMKGRGTTNEPQSVSLEAMEGSRLGIASRGESFSVSKIWQWSNKKGKFPAATAATSSGNTSPAGDFSWIRRSVADYT